LILPVPVAPVPVHHLEDRHLLDLIEQRVVPAIPAKNLLQESIIAARGDVGDVGDGVD
jgi:hypothetical protein